MQTSQDNKCKSKTFKSADHYQVNATHFTPWYYYAVSSNCRVPLYCAEMHAKSLACDRCSSLFYLKHRCYADDEV